MGRARSAVTLFEAVTVLFLLVMIGGQLLGQPVFLGFVTSNSMEPTLESGDGFVALPPALTGDIEEGDVVTFRAKELQGGGLTTHRVVEVTDRGYVTKGDNNPFADQDNEEPPVKRPQVVAVAWQPGGSIVVLPGVGLIVSGTQDVLDGLQRRLATSLGMRSLLGSKGLAVLITVLSLLAYATDVARSGGRTRKRDTNRASGTNPHLLIAVFTAAVVLGATATMVAPAGTQEFTLVSASNDSPGPSVIEAGTSEEVPYVLGNGGLLPVVVYSKPATAGVDVRPREVVIPGQSTTNATLTLSAPPETGYYRRYVVEHRYLLVLPLSTVRWLHGVHPWLPVVGIDVFLGTVFYGLGLALAGTGRLRSRTRETPSVFQRLVGRLR